jgi:hypothetical protein
MCEKERNPKPWLGVGSGWVSSHPKYPKTGFFGWCTSGCWVTQASPLELSHGTSGPIANAINKTLRNIIRTYFPFIVNCNHLMFYATKQNQVLQNILCMKKLQAQNSNLKTI